MGIVFWQTLVLLHIDWFLVGTNNNIVVQLLMLGVFLVIVATPVTILTKTPKEVLAFWKMDAHVALKLRACIKAFATRLENARIRPFATVDAFMATQVARRVEALRATFVVTDVRLGPCMDSHMASKRK